MTIKGFATFFTSRGKKEKDASLLSASANNNNNPKVPAIKVNDAFLAPPQRDARAPSPSPTTTGSTLSSAFARLHRPSLASLRKHVSPDAHSTHPHSPSSSSSHSHLQPHHHQHHPSTSSTTSSTTSRLALSRSFFRSVSDVSKSFATSNSTPSSSVVSTPATETCTLPPSSATSSTSTVHLTAGRKPSNASLINDMMILDPLALNENGKARHEALPRAPTPSQLDPHPQPSSTRLVVPQTSLAPTSTLLAPASSHPESSSRGVNDGPPSHPTANITSNNFDGYDPFAAHYTPPSSSTTRKRLSPPSVPALTTSGFASVGGTAPESLSPLQLAPKVGLSSSSPGGTVGKQQQQLLSVQTKLSAGRPRALSLGSTAHHHAQPPACPAHVLGPLPPLPPFAQGLVTKGTVLAAAGAVIQRIEHRNEEAPNSAPAHAVTFSGRDRSGSVASGGTTKSAGCNVTRRPSTGGGLPLSSSSSPSQRPRTSPRPSLSEKHWSGELLSKHHHHHHHGPIPLGKSLSEDMTNALGWPDIASPVRQGKRVPQLDQTWAQFLSETQSEFGMVASPSISSTGTGASTITARTSSTVRVAGGNSSGLVGQLPRGPPPNRPLPPAPVPIQPLNIRRRARAQTVGTTSPMVSPVAPAAPEAASSVTATVSQPVVGSSPAGGISPPISPPPTAGSNLDFGGAGSSSILDVVVTPAAESVDFEDIAKMMESGGSPATVSSLPYLRRSDSVNMSSTGLHAGGHSRNSSLSGSEWDASSRTVSEMSLSLFPAPPARPTPTTEPAVASASSLMPPPSSLSSVLELPTPPVTPTNHRFVPATPGLYSASVASRSTSTIRPSERDEAAAGDRDSCVLPPEDQVHLHHNTPMTRPPSVTEPSVRYSADSSRSEPDFISSATTVSSHEMDTSVEESLCRTSLDTDQTSEMMMHIVDSPPRSSKSSLRRKAAAAAGSSANARMLWCPPSPPQADRHSTQGKDKFNLLPNFYFDATFAGGAPVTNNVPGQPPSTPTKNRKSGVARREQLLNLLSANESAAQLRSPGSPWAGRVEWGEAL